MDDKSMHPKRRQVKWNKVLQCLSHLYDEYYTTGATSEAGIVSDRFAELLEDLMAAYDNWLD